MAIRPETRAHIDELIAEFPDKRSALLPAMKAVQHDDGWLKPEVLGEIAEIFEINPHVLYQLCSFYSMLHLKPRGKFHLELCDGLPCMLHGVENLCAHMEERLGVKAGETTPDNMVTFTRIECIGSCDRLPACLVNHLYVEELTPAKVDELIAALKRGELPVSLVRDPELAAH